MTNMSYTFNFQAVDRCLPISRSELLYDIVVNHRYGEVAEIWNQKGHFFITTNEGKKLFTFDCIPIHPHNFFRSSSFDVDSQTFIIQVILLSSSNAVVVEANGRTQWWRYAPSCDWIHTGSMELCTLIHSTVVSAVHIPSSDTLVWCEGNTVSTSSGGLEMVGQSESMVFSIKAKCVASADQKPREVEVEPVTTLVENCPACDLYVLGGNMLIIRTKVTKDQITVTIVCSLDLSPTTMFIGSDKFEINTPPVSECSLDFRSLLLKYLPSIIKTKLNYGDMGGKQDEKRIVSLSSSGLVEVFSLAGTDKTQIDHRVFTISFEDTCPTKEFWFLHRNYIGIIHKHMIVLYSMLDGSCVCKWTSKDMPSIFKVISSSSPSFLAWTITAEGLMALKAKDLKSKTAYTSVDTLPDDHLLETAVLQLSHLNQAKRQTYNKDTSDKLDKLRQVWNDGKGSHQCQITELIAPIVEEYWKLDSLALVSKEKQAAIEGDPNTIETNRFTEEFHKTSSLPRHARDSRLLWLSQVYPHDLLNTLTQNITLDCDEVPESELSEWQALLGIEGWDLGQFELVCRLLFQHHPQKLHHFVKCAESVSEQTVGVSAFIRKKHSMVFYRSALECLPPADTSCDPAMAAAVHGKLILDGFGETGVGKALNHLLHHCLWAEAVELVKSQASDKQHLPTYLYTTVSALAQNHSLSQFMPDILSLMHSWRSLLALSQISSCQSDVRNRQLSMSAHDLFYQGEGSDDVKLGSIIDLLMQLIPTENNKLS